MQHPLVIRQVVAAQYGIWRNTLCAPATQTFHEPADSAARLSRRDSKIVRDVGVGGIELIRASRQ